MTTDMTLDLLITDVELFTYTSEDSASSLWTQKSGAASDRHQKKFLHIRRTNVGIKDGKIAYVADVDLNPIAPKAKQIFSGSGLTAFPGIIDSQVHFREPGLTNKEDLETGTRAALAGGVTSVFEMPNTNPTTTTTETFQNKLQRAQGRSWCHIGFFIGAAVGKDFDNTAELAQLEKHKNCAGIKVFMGSSTGSLLVDNEDALAKIFQHGHRRIIIHAEDESRLKERKHIAIEKKDPHFHPVWRDEQTALIATKKAVTMALKYQRPVHILHISSSEEMQYLRSIKSQLATAVATSTTTSATTTAATPTSTPSKNPNLISVEILPQYLLLSSPSCYDQLGNLAQQNPPIRDQRHLPELWKAVLDGTVDVMGSDHAPHTLEEKRKEYPNSPSGVPGVQTMLPLMLDQVHQQKLSTQKLVDLLCENPRDVFGCITKGRIEVGLDADLTLVDLKAQRRIENKWIQSRCGWTPYDGVTVTGWPKAVFLKGQLAMHNDELLALPKGELVEFS